MGTVDIHKQPKQCRHLPTTKTNMIGIFYGII